MEMRFEGIEDFQISPKLTLDGGRCSCDPAGEKGLSPIALDRRGKPVDGETDKRPDENGEGEQLPRNAWNPNCHHPIWRRPVFEVDLFSV